MPAVWSVPKRVAFRFGFIYLVLYELPWLLKRPLLPDARETAESVGAFEGVDGLVEVDGRLRGADAEDEGVASA